MKKIIYLVLVSLFTLASCNLSNNNQATQAKQEIIENIRYKMFPTDNIWTFLKLDTRTGKIWQVQYSINDNNRGEIELNNQALIDGDSAENGRFTLYPTRNMFNFILLDQIDGKMWQVQWSQEKKNRLIFPMQ